MKQNTARKREELTDIELIKQIKKGDDLSFSELVTRHESKVFNLSRRILKDFDLAEDNLQETFILVFRKLDSFKGESSFASWLYRITTNTALMKLRDLKRDMSSLTSDHEGYQLEAALVDCRTSDDQYWSNELQAAVNDAIKRLPKIYRAAFILRDVYGLDTAEVAAALGMNTQGAKSRVHRARERMTKYLKQFWKDLH